VSVSASLTFEHLLFVSYAVPPERIRPLVPPELVLDTIVGADGGPLALVSAVAFHVRGASGPGGLTIPLDAAQLNLRTYVRPTGRSLYFIRAEIGSRPLGMLGEIGLRGASPAPILLAPDYDAATGRYRGYEVRCFSPAGAVWIEVVGEEVDTPPPAGFDSWQAAGRFVADRPVGFASSTLGGYVRLDVDHAPLEPAVGRLVGARLQSLERLGILTREEAAQPHSVFLKRRAVFGVLPPRPIFTPAGLRG
jgi:uncharacterized protein DUF2071